VRQELERVEVPGEHAARARTWSVLEAAFAEREPVARPSHWPRVAAVALALGALVAASLSAPGRAVIDEIREVVGVERAQPALFSLPSSGRLLVASDAGVWVVQEDGSKRLLGDYREASWSPFGRFVVAARANELAALEPDGGVRWTLARRGIRAPRWGGTETDTRIAYISGDDEREAVLRIVAGDGTSDKRLGPALPLPPAWRPTQPHVVTYVARRGGRIVLADADDGRRIRSWAAAPPGGLTWSEDGRRLFAFSPTSLRIYDARGRIVEARNGRFRHAALRPGATTVAEVAAIRTRAGASELVLGDRVLFRGPGEFRDLAWSPDGDWILFSWPTADQWVFVQPARRRIVAVSDVARQFGGGFPRIEGWCCAR
jgi:hypothetical protein